MLNLPCKCPKCGQKALIKGMQELPRKNLVLIDCDTCGCISDELKPPKQPKIPLAPDYNASPNEKIVSPMAQWAGQ